MCVTTVPAPLPFDGGNVNRILVIDSANLFVQYVELVVDRYGYSTMGVGSGIEAVKMLEKESFDLVIAQDSLPDMSWPDFIRSFKAGAVNIDTPFVLLSPDPDSFDESLCQGITLAKVDTRPFLMKDLLEIIQRHLPYQNRRRGIRASLPMKALIREGDQSLPCQILNLSEGGVFVMRKEPHPIGAPIELLIPLQDSKEPFKVQGKVVYVVETARGKHPRGMGIQFGELKEKIREKLRLYLDNHVSTMLGR